MQAVAREHRISEAAYYLAHEMRAYISTCKASLMLIKRSENMSDEDIELALNIAMESCQDLDIFIQQLLIDIFVHRLIAMEKSP